MGKVWFLVTGGGSREFWPPRLEQMLKGACSRFLLGPPEGKKGTRVGLGLGDDQIRVEPAVGERNSNSNGLLRIEALIPADVMEKLHPVADDDTDLRRFVEDLGAAAKRLGPENAWPSRKIQMVVSLVTVTPTEVSWTG